MPATIGYHIVISGYGLWLPGDRRGSWSDAWDDRLGFIEPHTLHAGDPRRLHMAQERMRHSPVRLDAPMAKTVVQALSECQAASDWSVEAASVEATHTHLLLTLTQRPIDRTVQWLKDQTTKAVHRETAHLGPVWSRGKWCSFVFDSTVWKNTRQYIERHNLRRGVGPRPYAFIRHA